MAANRAVISGNLLAEAIRFILEIIICLLLIVTGVVVLSGHRHHHLVK
jgi:hypothetical protein